MHKTLQFFIFFIYTFTNKNAISHLLSPKKIPIIIINFNQLKYLKLMIDFYRKRGFKNIIVIDNNSTYPPLLKYYDEVSSEIKIERISENQGHMVFFNSPSLIEKYAKGFYFLTDADVKPNPNLPKYFVFTLLFYLIRYSYMVNKVGFSLRIDNIPDHYPLKNKVLNWESRFWVYKIRKNVYRANIDTTFALYKPTHFNSEKNFLKAIRLAGDFTAEHMGWYLNPKNLSDEEIYYIENTTKSSSWKIDKNGNYVSVADTNYDNL